MLGLPNLGVNSAQVPLEARVASLFANGEEGAWYDPSNLSTLYQDAAGTTPVTALGQPVGLMLDKSGRGNHASQPTATARPTLQADEFGRKYLQFDGVDDFLATTAKVDFTGTDKMTVVAGVRKESDASRGIACDFGDGRERGFYLAAPQINGIANYAFGSGGFPVNPARSAAVFPSPDLAVLTGLASTAEPYVRVRRNGVQEAVDTATTTHETYENYYLTVGARLTTGKHFTGRIYSLLVRGALSTDAQIEAAERYANMRTGAY